MNVFDCAIKIEEEAKRYYEKLGSESSRSDMRDLFSMLAASEEEFRDTLIKLKNRLPPHQAQLDMLDGQVCRFRPLLSERELMEVSNDGQDLYMLSVREAEQEIEFYQDLAAKASDPATRACLLVLAEEERRHLSVVENIYDFVEAPKTFLAWGEFSNLHEL